MTETEIEINEYAKIVLTLPNKMNIDQMQGMMSSMLKASKYFESENSKTESKSDNLMSINSSNRYSWGEEDVKILKELWKQGKKPRQIAEQLNLDISKVHKKIYYLKTKNKLEEGIKNGIEEPNKIENEY